MVFGWLLGPPSSKSPIAPSLLRQEHSNWDLDSEAEAGKIEEKLLKILKFDVLASGTHLDRFKMKNEP